MRSFNLNYRGNEKNSSSLARAIARGIIVFWRFSLYYGKYIATPVQRRHSIENPHLTAKSKNSLWRD
jgi:hypothetical protein